jgi:RimK family alpha-L-glutamate ligase
MQQMTGCILYQKGELEKNTRFVTILRDDLLQDGITLVSVCIDLNVTQAEIRAQLLALPQCAFVINRTRSALIAQILESQKIRIYNHSTVTKIANDKLLTARHLATHGIPVMDTIPFRAEEEAPPFSNPFVIKSADGHGGSEVMLVTDGTSFIHVKEQIARCMRKTHWIAQPLCDEPGLDVRVYVLGGEPVLFMKRRNPHSFRSNYSLGGMAEQISPDEELLTLTRKVVESFPCVPDYAGIDFIRHQGHYVCNEIEDVVGARMVYENTDMDIVTEYAAYIRRNL